MSIANQTSFQKGEVTNPNGRPKGSYSEHKKKFIEIQKRAANDANDVYDQLQKKIVAGESWAYQIYYKELYVLPKNYNQDSIAVDLPKEISKQRVDVYLAKFIEALARFDEFTKDEIVTIIKVLSNAEIAENMTKDQPNEFEKFSERKLRQIRQVMDEPEENEVAESGLIIS